MAIIEGMARHLPTSELEAGLTHIRNSPQDIGTVELIVRRPAVGEREILKEGRLEIDRGLVGDTWLDRPSRLTEDGSPHPEMQINVMNSRCVSLVADDPARWALAGDQLYVDLDLSVDNLAPGSRLALGSAVIEVTAQPHRGCAKFSGRFGLDALRFVNSPVGQHLRLRGLNARVVEGGVVVPGDSISKI